MKTRKVIQLYRKENPSLEYCFNIETSKPLTSEEMDRLKLILAHGFVAQTISEQTKLDTKEIVELGPRMNFATPFHTNVSSILHDCGLDKITRIERSRRYVLPCNTDREEFVRSNHDRMTEFAYPKPLSTFDTGIIPEAVYEIPMIEKGPDALLEIPGLAMDEWDRNFYYQYFVERQDRNPTNVEIADLANANSEHCRHGYFRGQQILGGIKMPYTLMEIVKATLQVNPINSLIAFRDNSSAIRGYEIWTILPEYPGQPSRFVEKRCVYHITLTAETHNFPSGIAPVPGAETGTGGRIRDNEATGMGAIVIAGTTGYCVGNLLIPGYILPWENSENIYPSNMALPLNIEIQASNGASDYGNKFGEPVILGYTRSFDQRLRSNERLGWVKPIMFTGGIGQIDGQHTEKGFAAQGLLIVQVGGPAYRIGVGGGASSSMLQGKNKEELDFKAVQRGDPEMEQKMNRVIRACVEMGATNPIISIHDQGAGGSANVLKELVERSGGRIEIRNFNLGDPTLSVLEIWIAEYQERNGFLIHPNRIKEFQAICVREKVNCEILGKVTGDGFFIVHDESDDSTPVNFELNRVLGNLPQKTFEDERVDPKLSPLNLSPSLTFAYALELVLKNLAVSSKRFLTTKVDRSVTGLIAQQQCCGPLQLTVSDVAVIAQSHFGITGAATSIGEQPIKMLISPAAGARMAVGEALTNIVWARLSGIKDIKCSVNWMWAPKLPGEGVAIYEAALALRDVMISLSIAVDGGKDSLSMATLVGNEVVKSPREMVVSAYCTVPDIRNVVTPDIKRPGKSRLIFVDLAHEKCRLGGSILAQVLGQIGKVCPDLEDPVQIKQAFDLIQQLISEDLILAGHDVSDGGLITTILEMAFSGNCGLDIDMFTDQTVFERMFSEELGLVIECDEIVVADILNRFSKMNIPTYPIGTTLKDQKIRLNINGEKILSAAMPDLRQTWEETSYQLERLQANPDCADAEKKNIKVRNGSSYHLTFVPEQTQEFSEKERDSLPIAILREEGSNGDREMTSAFYTAGFRPYDVSMKDLLDGSINLNQFRGIAAVGGFSYADYPDSAKGWAAIIRENPDIWQQFNDFYERSDTFSLGVCNGCQLFALIGWVPWPGITDIEQPRFVQNISGRFESRWTNIKIVESPSIMLKNMAGSRLGIWVAHGEGRLYCPEDHYIDMIRDKCLAPMVFVDDDGIITERYPFNPNGSPLGITALCTPDGRHLAMMPHPERTFLKWQWPWLPKEQAKEWAASPWLKMFQNARVWCEQNI